MRKCIVLIAFLLECVQIVLSTYDCFRVFGRGWGNPLQLNDIGLLGLSICAIAALCTCIYSEYEWHVLIVLFYQQVQCAKYSTVGECLN